MASTSVSDQSLRGAYGVWVNDMRLMMRRILSEEGQFTLDLEKVVTLGGWGVLSTRFFSFGLQRSWNNSTPLGKR